MSIGKGMFGQLIGSCGELVDGKLLKIADVDLAFIAATSGNSKRGKKLIPADQIIRFNFMEVMVRLIEQRYVKSGLCRTFLESI